MILHAKCQTTIHSFQMIITHVPSFELTHHWNMQILLINQSHEHRFYSHFFLSFFLYFLFFLGTAFPSTADWGKKELREREKSAWNTPHQKNLPDVSVVHSSSVKFCLQGDNSGCHKNYSFPVCRFLWIIFYFYHLAVKDTVHCLQYSYRNLCNMKCLKMNIIFLFVHILPCN